MIHCYRAGHEGLHIHELRCQTLRVIKIGHAAGHPGSEICSNRTKDHGHTAGHVFAAIGATPFDHDMCAGIAHGKSLTGAPCREQMPSRRTVKHGVADNRVLFSL